MAICTTCSKGEEVTGYQYSSRGCLYDTFEECMRINNPQTQGGFYWDTVDNCPTFFIDNADTWNSYNTSICAAQYGFWDNNTNSGVARIPHRCVSPDGTVPGGISDFDDVNAGSPMTGAVQSRLWAYDIVTNQTQFVKSLTHEGSDIATTDNKMWTTCQYNLAKWNYNLPFKGMAILTVNEVDFTMDETKVETFQSTPTKVYRFVDDYGNLLTKTKPFLM